jgi:hypothetical protein
METSVHIASHTCAMNLLAGRGIAISMVSLLVLVSVLLLIVNLLLLGLIN